MFIPFYAIIHSSENVPLGPMNCSIDTYTYELINNNKPFLENKCLDDSTRFPASLSPLCAPS